MWKVRFGAITAFLIGALLAYFVYSSEAGPNERFHFKLGLDLAGGTHLVYRADTSALPDEDIEDSMEALRSVIERRVNLFGVSEPIVQVEESGIFSGVSEQRLIVELPGVTDTEEAIKQLGETPVLDFRLLRTDVEVPDSTEPLTPEQIAEYFENTPLTGRYLQGATLEFNQGTGGVSNQPIVLLQFTGEGADVFAELTRDNVGRVLGIFLDGVPISLPVIQEEITGGRASITGTFTPEEGRDLARNLNLGALPVPIELLSTQTVGASLGGQAIETGTIAFLWGLVSVMLFMVIWYRIPGIIAALSLSIYVIAMLALFKIIPVTLTAAGIAGFILSVGMAVDANVLIFERIKEELKGGASIRSAVRAGFLRAWNSIRDANLSSIIIAIILFWLGTSIVEGFALTFGLGVIVSMVTAISVSRTFLLLFPDKPFAGLTKALFGSGTNR